MEYSYLQNSIHVTDDLCITLKYCLQYKSDCWFSFSNNFIIFSFNGIKIAYYTHYNVVFF